MIWIQFILVRCCIYSPDTPMKSAKSMVFNDGLYKKTPYQKKHICIHMYIYIWFCFSKPLHCFRWRLRAAPITIHYLSRWCLSPLTHTSRQGHCWIPSCAYLCWSMIHLEPLITWIKYITLNTLKFSFRFIAGIGIFWGNQVDIIIFPFLSSYVSAHWIYITDVDAPAIAK